MLQQILKEVDAAIEAGRLYRAYRYRACRRIWRVRMGISETRYGFGEFLGWSQHLRCGYLPYHKIGGVYRFN